jgi:hypothetical protein
MTLPLVRFGGNRQKLTTSHQSFFFPSSHVPSWFPLCPHFSDSNATNKKRRKLGTAVRSILPPWGWQTFSTPFTYHNAADALLVLYDMFLLSWTSHIIRSLHHVGQKNIAGSVFKVLRYLVKILLWLPKIQHLNRPGVFSHSRFQPHKSCDSVSPRDQL